jgi:hypothetical protein
MGQECVGIMNLLRKGGEKLPAHLVTVQIDIDHARRDDV